MMNIKKLWGGKLWSVIMQRQSANMETKKSFQILFI